MDTLHNVFLLVLLSYYIMINHGCMNICTPYNLTFISSSFEWQGEEPIISMPEYERIQFFVYRLFDRSDNKNKVRIRIVSPYDNTILQRPVYIHVNDIPKKVSLDLKERE